MSLVCLDTHYFEWGILLKAKPSQQENIQAAVEFFDWLDRTKATIVVPTPLVTEILMGADPEERLKILTVLESKFWIREFDTLAAKYAADIWIKKKKSGLIDQLREEGVSLRTKIKVDTQILATAMAAGATVFYTEDKKLTQLADGFIPVQKMPVQLQATFLATLDAAPPPQISAPVEDALEQLPVSETAKGAAPETGDSETK